MDGPAALWLTTALFTLTYVGLALGKVPGLRMDRAGIALVGAVLMLVFGLLPFTKQTLADALDFDTLFLLFGMMVVVGMLRLSGFFQRLTDFALSRIRSPRGMLAAVIVLSGGLSAFLINDVVCVALTPLVLHLARRLRYDPVPHADRPGDGGQHRLVRHDHRQPAKHLHRFALSYSVLSIRPAAGAARGCWGWRLAFLATWFVYRRRLAAPKEADVDAAEPPAAAPTDPPGANVAAGKSVLVALAAVVLFFVLPSEDLPIVALAAAAVVLIGRVKPEKIYRQVDWALLVMFTGLFLVVHAFQDPRGEPLGRAGVDVAAEPAGGPAERRVGGAVEPGEQRAGRAAVRAGGEGNAGGPTRRRRGWRWPCPARSRGI